MTVETLEVRRNPGFIFLAIVSAFLGSFTSSRIINRRSGSRGVLNTVLLLVSSISVAWGASGAMLTWSLAALTIVSPSGAFHDVEAEVNERDYLLALTLGLGLSTFALGLAGDPNHPSKRRFYIGGVINGIGLLFMQSFAITQGISVEPVVVVVNRPSLVPVSLLFMVTCSALAWRIFFRSQALWEATVWNYRVHVISGALFAFGLLCMHFIGLSSFDFEVDLPVVFNRPSHTRIGRGVLITISTLFLCFTALALIISEVRTYFYIQAVQKRKGHMLLSVMFAYTEPEGEAHFPAAKHKMVTDAMARSRSQPDESVSPFSAGKCHNPSTQLILCDRIGFLPGVLVDEQYNGKGLFNKDNPDFSRMLRASFNWTDTDFPEGKSDAQAHKEYSDRLFSKFLHAVLYLAHKLHVEPNDMGCLYYKPINLDEGVMLLLVSRINLLETATALTSVGRFKWGLQPLVEPMIYRMYNDADLYGEREQSWLDDAIEYEHACTKALPQPMRLVSSEAPRHVPTGFNVPAPSVRVVDSPGLSRSNSTTVKSAPIPAVVSIDPKTDSPLPASAHDSPIKPEHKTQREVSMSLQSPALFNDAIQASHLQLSRQVQKQFDDATDPEVGGLYVALCVLRISVSGLAVAVDPTQAIHMFPCVPMPGHSGLLRPEEREFLRVLFMRSPHFNIAEANPDSILSEAFPAGGQHEEHRPFAASFVSATRELAAKVGNSADLTVRNLCNLGVLRVAVPEGASSWLPYDAVDLPSSDTNTCMHPSISHGELECGTCGGYEKVGSIRPVRVIVFGMTMFSREDHLEGYNTRLLFLPLPTFEAAHFGYHQRRAELAVLREEIMKESDSLRQAPARRTTASPLPERTPDRLTKSFSLNSIHEKGASPIDLMQSIRTKSFSLLHGNHADPETPCKPAPASVLSRDGIDVPNESPLRLTREALADRSPSHLTPPAATSPTQQPTRAHTSKNIHIESNPQQSTNSSEEVKWLAQLMTCLSEQNKERNEERHRVRRQSLPVQPASTRKVPRRNTTVQSPSSRQDSYRITVRPKQPEVQQNETKVDEPSVLSNTESTGSARRAVIDMGEFGDDFGTCELPANPDERDSPAYRAANTTVPNMPPPAEVEMVDTVYGRESSDVVHRMRDGATVRVARRPRFAVQNAPQLEMFQMLDEYEDKVGVHINRKSAKQTKSGRKKQKTQKKKWKKGKRRTRVKAYNPEHP